MSEFRVHAVDPTQEGPFQSFVSAHQKDLIDAAIDFDSGGMKQTVYAAEQVDHNPDGTDTTHIVGAMVCRWGIFGAPDVKQVVDPQLNGHTQEVIEGFAKTRASLSDLTGLNF